MRYLVLDLFTQWLDNEKPILSKVCVVGGTSSDPEIVVLKNSFPTIEFHTYGIENPSKDKNFHELDLNRDQVSIQEGFDLVLCSQVLEHVWNLENSFACLSDLTKPGGYLWLACPASNMPHGSPEYYSAGYTSEFLALNLENRNFEIILRKNLGSKRNYFITHALRQWVGEKEHNHPVKSYKIQPGTFLGNSRKYLREIPGRILALIYSKQVTESVDYATESVVLARAKES